MDLEVRFANGVKSVEREELTEKVVNANGSNKQAAIEMEMCE